MAYIERTTDPFHPTVFICSHCNFPLIAYGYYDPENMEKYKLIDPSTGEALRKFPTKCPRCRAGLELKDGLINFSTSN